MTMRRPVGTPDRTIALFLLGLVAFSPALLLIFGRDAQLFGWPSLFVYIFSAWAGLILLIALHVERRSRSSGRSGSDARDDR
jgi:hypothetical protein